LRKFLGKFGLHGQLALQQIRTLSGGQKARLVFATLAAQVFVSWKRFVSNKNQGPHLMLLDEPSNHLDIFAIEALTEGLQAYVFFFVNNFPSEKSWKKLRRWLGDHFPQHQDSFSVLQSDVGCS
jgi:ABC-type uncharacterized transport system YnjBCD ATPase subunit